ncbi:IS481 family transposase, partial [Myceligenerans sp. I2]|nr:IS481 family transposase [Myceligenerans indicum]
RMGRLVQPAPRPLRSRLRLTGRRRARLLHSSPGQRAGRRQQLNSPQNPGRFNQGWPLRRAADRFGVSVTCAHRWATRYRQHGPAGMVDRSSRPRSCPHRTTGRLERRVLGLRVSRRWGPARIAYHLGLNISTVGRVLARYDCPRLSWTDPATGTRIRRARPIRYEHPAPGDLIHVDIKKLGRIPDGGGHKALGRAAGRKNRHAHQDPARPRRKNVSGGRPNLGYVYLHHAVDDHSRLAYSEMLPDETKQTAAAFMTRALEHFQTLGITVTRVLTDNGACYRSRDFAKVLTDAQVKHKRTYRPQTNGKVERFNRTLQEEWAYARAYTSESERAAAYPGFLHRYNHHRPHTALEGSCPADRVPNLPGQYT